MRHPRTTCLLAMLACAMSLGAAHERAFAAATPPPDDKALGSVDVTGAATVASQKLAIVPVLTQGDADVVTQLVVRRDLELSGQFDVASADAAPDGPFLRSMAIDPKAWAAKGVDVLVRVTSDAGKDRARTFTAEVWLPKTGRTTTVEARTTTFDEDHVRLGAHSLADAILDATTGRAGSFESRMVFARAIGTGRQVQLIDADGFGLHGVGPASQTALSPTFGPKDDVYYALSTDSLPFRLVHGDAATPAAWPALGDVGGVLGVAFSSDRRRVALTTMRDGASQVLVGNADGTQLSPLKTSTFATHPVLGPLGKTAWVAGSPSRVFVDGKAISPAGFSASAPTFCDSPKGLFVVFTVGVLDGADLVATDVDGNGLFRLTQGQGSNRDPACSPDGRLVAFFSTRTSGKGPGLYVMPLLAPWRAQPITDVQGTTLRWESITP
ncbi:MAG: tolB protein [Polyangiales bacterium]